MKTLKLLLKLSVKQLILIPVIFSIFIILIMSLTKNSNSERTQDFLILLVLYSWGAIGIPIIIKKEFPAIVAPIRGWIAISQGCFILLGFWTPAIYISFKMLFG